MNEAFLVGWAVGFFVAVGTAIWVLVDSQSLLRSGVTKEDLNNTPPAVWFFGCLLMWIIAFPWYLGVRASAQRKADRRRVGSSAGAVPRVVTAPASAQPSPGWYTDPTGKIGQRYWDGAAWTRQERPLPPPADGPAAV